jgi:hypothetical protein
MLRWFALLFLPLTIAHSVSGQIIYEPVRYQYGEYSKFYYGGSDPAIIDFGYAQTYPGNYPSPIYSDARRYENVAIYGYTTSDARNEAYANVPQYFRKRDLIAAGEPLGNGTIIVGAPAQPVPATYDPPADSAAPQPIIIIPAGRSFPRLASSNNIVMIRN